MELKVETGNINLPFLLALNHVRQMQNVAQSSENADIEADLAVINAVLGDARGGGVGRKNQKSE